MNSSDFRPETILDLKQNLGLYYHDIDNILLNVSSLINRLLSNSEWDTPTKELLKQKLLYIKENYDLITHKLKSADDYLDSMYNYYKRSESILQKGSEELEEVTRGLNDLFN